MSQVKHDTIKFADQVPSFPKTEGLALCTTMFFHLPDTHPFRMPAQNVPVRFATEAPVSEAMTSYLKVVSNHPIKKEFYDHGQCAKAIGSDKPCSCNIFDVDE